MNNCVPPALYDYANKWINQENPNTIHVKNTAMERYFTRYLLQKAMSVFKWALPKTWASDYFKYVLYCWGWIAVVNTDKFGIICQQCGLRGYDVFYRPTNAVIVNPLLRGMLEPKIDVQCTVLKLQPDYGNIMDLVTYYADLMTLVTEAIAVTAFNTKNAYVFAAGNNGIAESIKKMYDNIASGNPAVVVDKKLFDTNNGKMMMEVFGDGKQSTIINELISALRYLEQQYDRDIGLPSTPTSNKERDLVDEVRTSTINSVSKVGMWLQLLQEDCEKTRRMFGIDISVDWRVPPTITTGGDNNASNNEPVCNVPVG